MPEFDRHFLCLREAYVPQPITAEALFAQVEAYRPSSSSGSLLADSEPYLFSAVSDSDGDIHGNDDFRIEDLTEADLDCPVDFA